MKENFKFRSCWHVEVGCSATRVQRGDGGGPPCQSNFGSLTSMVSLPEPPGSCGYSVYCAGFKSISVVSVHATVHGLTSVLISSARHRGQRQGMPSLGPLSSPLSTSTIDTVPTWKNPWDAKYSPVVGRSERRMLMRRRPSFQPASGIPSLRASWPRVICILWMGTHSQSCACGFPLRSCSRPWRVSRWCSRESWPTAVNPQTSTVHDSIFMKGGTSER